MKFWGAYTELLDNKRQSWIDYDRGISIILVTYRHAFEMMSNAQLSFDAFPFLEYINVFLFGFRMPLFFITSGIFLSVSLDKKGFKSYNYSRFQTILYPMMVWGVLQISLQIAFTDHTNFNHSSFDLVWLIIDPRRTGQFWYLHTLFFVGMIYAFNKTRFKWNAARQIGIGILMYASLAFIRSRGLYLGFAMDILQYYVFFALGDFISSTIRNKEYQKHFSSFLLLLVLVPLFCVVQYNFAAINMEFNSNYYVEHHMPLFFMVIALVGCALSINLAFVLGKYNLMAYLRIVGYHSIHIYCMQIILMATVRKMLMRTQIHVPIPIFFFILVFAGILLPIIAYNTLIKMNCWWLFSPEKMVSKKIETTTKRTPVWKKF